MAFQSSTIEIRILDGGLSSGTTSPPDGPPWVLGPAQTGPFTPFTASQAVDLKSTFAWGDGLEAALYALNNEVSSVTFLRVDPTDGIDGAYGPITVESQGAGIEVTGDAVVLPGGEWEPVIRFTRGGTIGVAPGPAYQYSLDNGQKFSGARELGSDTSISLPLGGGKYNLVGKELARLIARVNDVADKALDHVARVGGVHGSADTEPYAVATATDDASVIAACGDLKDLALTHVLKVSGAPAIHGGADTTAQTAIAALGAPATRDDAVVFIEKFVLLFFGDENGAVNSGHAVRTAGAVHGAPDTDAPASLPAVAGDVVSGDFFFCSNTGPRWSIESLVSAITKVKDSSAPCNGVLEIVGPVLTSAEAGAIEDALEGLGDKYRDVRAVGHWRWRNEGESLQAYAAAFALAHPLVASSGRQGRLALTAYSYPPSQLVPGAVSARPFAFSVAPRLARTAISTNAISEVDFGTLKGALRAADGYTVLPRGADDAFADVCTPVRLWAPRSDPSGILSSKPVTLAPDGSDFGLMHYGRVIDAVKKAAYPSLKRRMGQKVAPQPGTVLIDRNEAKRIGEAETKRLQVLFVDTGQVAGARVIVELNSVVSGVGQKIAYVSMYVRPVGYFEDIRATLQFAL